MNEQDFNSNLDGAKPVSIRVTSIKMHENYNSNNIDNDIAVSLQKIAMFENFTNIANYAQLLQLANPVPLGNEYIPICLPSASTSDFTGIQATVVNNYDMYNCICRKIGKLYFCDRLGGVPQVREGRHHPI